MRSQLEDQVRRTLGGQRPDNSDVWDVATTEIPPEAGEAPECQWCPICRAARRMRDSRPGLAGQLSGAGDAVASAMQDAVRAFDTFLARTAGGGDRPATAGSEPDDRPPPQPDSGGAPGRPDSLTGEHGPVGWKPGDRLATAGPAVFDPWGTATAPGEPAEGATSEGATSEGATSDGATSGGGGTNGSSSPGGSGSGGSDGRGHGPSDRG